MYDAARYTAVKSLTEIEERKSFSNIKLDSLFQRNKLNAIDRGFATEIVYGTLRWKLKIDYIIKTFLKSPNKKIDSWILNCIRIGVYQIIFLDKVPDYAAVNQSVEISKVKDKRSSSLVNAILRNVIRNKEKLQYFSLNNEVEELSINYSHPEWLIEKMLKIYDKSFLIDFMKKNNTPPPLSIRINTLKTNYGELKSILEEEDIKVYKGVIDDALRIENFHMIEKSNVFNEGLFTIQDESSMIAVLCLNPKENEKVMDLCSAPGGKSTYMAQIMKNKGEIISFDIYEHKLKLINENAERLGINIIEPLLKDSTIYMEEYDNWADKVLVDAPCSGIGLIRKKPEIKWNINCEDINMLAGIQYSILNNAAKYVRIGGIILYSTCTITQAEDENVVNKFLEEHKNFEFDSIQEFLPTTFVNSTINEGSIKLLPNVHDTDGFYIARLKRIG